MTWTLVIGTLICALIGSIAGALLAFYMVGRSLPSTAVISPEVLEEIEEAKREYGINDDFEESSIDPEN